MCLDFQIFYHLSEMSKDYNNKNNPKSKNANDNNFKNKNNTSNENTAVYNLKPGRMLWFHFVNILYVWFLAFYPFD